METPLRLGTSSAVVSHSDPTYEAWKQYLQLMPFYLPPYSDPTYEAWKLTSLVKGEEV